MRAARLPLVFLVVCACALVGAACGLDVTGSGAGEDGNDASTSQDALVEGAVDPDGADAAGLEDAASDVTSIADADGSGDTGACGVTVPPGWSPVTYAANRVTPCPTGATPSDLIEGPVPGAGACGCATCAIGTHQSCNTGTITFFYDTVGVPICPLAGSVLVNGTSCATVPLRGVVSHYKMAPPTPTGASACTASGVADKNNVQVTSIRVCREASPPTGCDAAATTCVAQAGDRACPPGFGTRHLVGDDVSLTCTSCGCSVSTTCTATTAGYPDNTCSSGAVPYIADNTCRVPQPASANPAYYAYLGSIGAETCTLKPGTPNLALTNAQTVCCP